MNLKRGRAGLVPPAVSLPSAKEARLFMTTCYLFHKTFIEVTMCPLEQISSQHADLLVLILEE